MILDPTSSEGGNKERGETATRRLPSLLLSYCPTRRIPLMQYYEDPRSQSLQQKKQKNPTTAARALRNLDHQKQESSSQSQSSLRGKERPRDR